MDYENVIATKKFIEELVADVEKPGCDGKRVTELKETLEFIGSNPDLFAKYEDIYDDAADALMLAGVSSDECSCDPLRKHTPADKTD